MKPLGAVRDREGGRAPNPAHIGDVLRDVVTALIREAVRAELEERQPPPAETILVDREGLARALGGSLSMVDRMRKEPGFPELRLGEAPRFEVAAVLEWLRARGGSP